MKTVMTNSQTVEKKWYLVDATGLTLGRLASQVAKIINGKNKVNYTPYVDSGDFVIVINAKDMVLTGKKLTQKYYRAYSGYVGGLREIQYKELMEKDPCLALTNAVKGMLPKSALGKHMLTKLKVYADANHGHEAQKPEEIKIVKGAK
jgi:large subunit ribosomal protein L13